MLSSLGGHLLKMWFQKEQVGRHGISFAEIWLDCTGYLLVPVTRYLTGSTMTKDFLLFEGMLSIKAEKEGLEIGCLLLRSGISLQLWLQERKAAFSHHRGPRSRGERDRK